MDKRITPVRLEFQETRTPYSPMFKDVYFQAEQGIEESTYIYLNGTGFSEACKNRPEQKQFTVGEIGFGVGLNFLLSYRHFLEHSKPDQKLTYLSVEKYPIHLEDLVSLYSRFPELSSVSKDLLDQYPVLTPGFHSLSLSGGRVKLILMLGDAHELFPQVELAGNPGIEFWYLDGFAPSRNPDAFQDTIFASLSRISFPNACGASFTTASWVRRSLESLGFKINKRPGFGKKRECMTVLFPTAKPEIQKKSKNAKIIVENPVFLKSGDSIAVIGGRIIRHGDRPSTCQSRIQNHHHRTRVDRCSRLGQCDRHVQHPTQSTSQPHQPLLTTFADAFNPRA